MKFSILIERCPFSYGLNVFITKVGSSTKCVVPESRKMTAWGPPTQTTSFRTKATSLWWAVGDASKTAAPSLGAKDALGAGQLAAAGLTPGSNEDGCCSSFNSYQLCLMFISVSCKYVGLYFGSN